MFGRVAELSAVLHAMKRSSGVGVALIGEAGIGKSSLLSEAIIGVETEGFAVVRVFGSRAAATLPLCALSSLLVPGFDDRTVERFVAIRRALLDHANGRPLVLAIDDAHLLDDASAVLVSQLARERAAFVICTVRSGEPAPEPLSALWLDGSITLIPVEPVTREAALEIATAALGGRMDAALEAELWRRTAGNPLFLRELTLGSLASGALKSELGVWTRTGALATSEALADLVRQRLAALEPVAQLTLMCVALSEPASVGLIEAVADPDALIQLEESGLVKITSDRRRLIARLGHPLYGEVIRSQSSQLRARKLRRALADAVESFGARRRDDTLAIATWRLEAGDVDPVRFASAAFDAIRSYDIDLAERLASAAHEHEPSELSARALAMTRHLLGRHAEALVTLAEPLANVPARTAEWARIGLLDGLVRARGAGDYRGARAVLAEVTACAAPTRTIRRAQAMIAMIELLQGEAETSRRLAEMLVDGGAEEAEAFTALVGSTAATGRPAAALGIAREFIARFGDADGRSLFPDFYWVALLEAGEVAVMCHEVSEAWERAVDVSDRHSQARAALVYGHALLDRGQAASARTWFETSAGLARLTGERFCERWALSGRLLASAQLGDVDDARAAGMLLEDAPDHPAAFFEVYGERGRGWLEALAGQPTRARAALIHLSDRLRRAGCVAQSVRTLLDVARLGDPAAAAAHLENIDEHLDGAALPALVQFVRALATSSSAGLAASAQQLASLGYAALAAEAANAARDAFARDGHAREANAWARRASELKAETDGGATPLFTVIETISPLTRREREIAALVAAGRTSREVANACFLSVRTVESHLARVFDKLGVRSRGELSEVMSARLVGQEM